MAYGNSGTAIAGNARDYVGAPAPPRQSVISEQMVTLEQRAEALGHVVGELEARIGPVLMPEPPGSTNKDASALPSSVPLGASLAQMNDRLHLIASKLRNIIERVEL